MLSSVSFSRVCSFLYRVFFQLLILFFVARPFVLLLTRACVFCALAPLLCTGNAAAALLDAADEREPRRGGENVSRFPARAASEERSQDRRGGAVVGPDWLADLLVDLLDD